MDHTNKSRNRRAGARANDDARRSGRSQGGVSSPVTRLQRRAGNRTIRTLYERGTLQANLEVASPSDPAEREAERVADEVLRAERSDATDARFEGSVDVHRSPSQDASGGSLTDDVAGRVRSSLGGGKPLPEATRSAFESRFGRDFTDVRVHTGPRADDAARTIDAEAFAIGSDVAFASGNYDPESRAGERLLAHELTHVVQQSEAARTDAVYRQERPETESADVVPPSPDSEPTPERVERLRRWLTQHIAHRSQAAETYTFYEVVDEYLGPWGERGYPIGYGKKYNIEFNASDTLTETPVTAEWLRRVEVRLQVELRDFIVARYQEGTLDELEEPELRQFAFESHAEVYTDAGLSRVIAEAPHLVVLIVAIPSEEFRPDAADFEESIEQVLETTGIVVNADLLQPPARAAAKDRDALMNTVRTNRYLGRLERGIENGEFDNIITLNRLTEQLWEMEYPDEQLRAYAQEEVVPTANDRKRRVAANIRETLRTALDDDDARAEIEPIIDEIQPGWRDWLDE